MGRCHLCHKEFGLFSLESPKVVDGKEFCPECAKKYTQQQKEEKKARELKERDAREAKAKKEEEEWEQEISPWVEERGWENEATKKRIKGLEERIASDPNNPISHFELGQILHDDENFHEHDLGKFFERKWGVASPSSFKEPSLKEKRVWSAAEEAYAYYRSRWEECFTKALALGLPSPVQRGIAHHALGCRCSYSRWPADHFEREWDSLLRFEPRDKSERVYHVDEAAREFKSYLKSNPDDVETMYRLAHVLGVLGRKKERGKILAWAKETEVRKGLGLSSPQAEAEPRASKDKGVSFEEKCLELLKAMGFICRKTATTGDGGIDIFATSSQPFFRGIYIIQCKDWKNPVGEPPVRDLYGVVASEKASKGILITSSTFTQAAQDFARGKNIELIDGEQLERLIGMHLKKVDSREIARIVTPIGEEASTTKGDAGDA